MEKKEDQARLAAFMRSQLRPFVIVVFVYAILENWWIYYMPGNQLVPPYFCLFIYNLLLIWSTWLLCVKDTRFYSRFNMIMAYFFPFAVEIFNTGRFSDTVTPYEYRLFEPRHLILEDSDVYKYTIAVRILGVAFFIYAIHVRSKCLEFLRGGPKMRDPNESLWAFFTNLRPSETEIPKSRLRWFLPIIVVAHAVTLTLFQLFLIFQTTNAPKSIVTFFVAAHNASVVISTILFYFQRSIFYNIFNMICAYGLIVQHWTLGLLSRLYPLWSLDRWEAEFLLVFNNCTLYAMGGISFVFLITVRSILLDDCGQLASARRLLTLFKSRKTSVQPFDTDADKKAEKEKMTNYGTV